MKLIELTQGRVALVDDEDFEWLSQWKWYYHRYRKTGYAMRNGPSPKRGLILMHVTILQRHKRWACGRGIDHINMCGCDNRKENLRLATSSANGMNAGLRLDNTSGVKGVNWHKAGRKWQARICINQKETFLGLFTDMDDAIKAREQAEIKYFGKYRHDLSNVCPLGSTGECPDCAQRLRELQ